MHNPSRRIEPRTQKATIVPSEERSSILDWLENSGRLISRDTQERDILKSDEEDEEINELMGNDSNSFDEEDTDVEE